MILLKGRSVVWALVEEKSADRLRVAGFSALVETDRPGVRKRRTQAAHSQACLRYVPGGLQTFRGLVGPPRGSVLRVDMALRDRADGGWTIVREGGAILKMYVAYTSAHPVLFREGSPRRLLFCRGLQGWRRLGPLRACPPVPGQVVALVERETATQRGSPDEALREVTRSGACLSPSVAVGQCGQDLFLPGGLFTDCGFDSQTTTRGECSSAIPQVGTLLLGSGQLPCRGPLQGRAGSPYPHAPPLRLSARRPGYRGRRALERVCVAARHYRSMAANNACGRWAVGYARKRYGAHAPGGQELAALPPDARRTAEAGPAELHAEVEGPLDHPRRARTALPAARLQAASASATRRRAPTAMGPRPPPAPGLSSSSCAALLPLPEQSTPLGGLRRAGIMLMIQEPTFLMTPSSTGWWGGSRGGRSPGCMRASTARRGPEHGRMTGGDRRLFGTTRTCTAYPGWRRETPRK